MTIEGDEFLKKFIKDNFLGPPEVVEVIDAADIPEFAGIELAPGSHGSPADKILERIELLERKKNYNGSNDGFTLPLRVTSAMRISRETLSYLGVDMGFINSTVKVSITHPENSEGSDLEVILQGNCENQRVLYRLEGGKCLRDFQRSTKEGERLGDSNLGLSESIDELADISLALKFAS